MNFIKRFFPSQGGRGGGGHDGFDFTAPLRGGPSDGCGISCQRWKARKNVSYFASRDRQKIDVGGVRVKRELVSKQNYLTLLNLEETINRFGPMRLLWEGGRMGE